MIEWETILLYLVGLLGLLMLAALLVWALFYLYSYKCDKETDLGNDDHEVNSNTIRTYINNKRRAEDQIRAKKQDQLEKSTDKGKSSRNRHKQTMLSSLHRLANQTDVVVASAISSIPLRELGANNNEVVVNVGQQMYLSKEELDKNEHQCILCKSRKEIAWNRVSCYAHTTIGVIVYKRSSPTDAATKKDATFQKQPLLSVVEELRSNSVGVVPLTSSLGEPKSKSVSTVNIAPSPDSRIQAPSLSRPKSLSSSEQTIVQEKSLNLSQKLSNSANFSNKSPPPPSQSGGGSRQVSRRPKSPTQASGSSRTSTQQQR